MTLFCLLTSRFLGLVLIYLVVGSAYQYFGKQERGIRILPNYDFWMAFAGYVWVSILIPEYREEVYRCSHTELLELLCSIASNSGFLFLQLWSQTRKKTWKSFTCNTMTSKSTRFSDFSAQVEKWASITVTSWWSASPVWNCCLYCVSLLLARTI